MTKEIISSVLNLYQTKSGIELEENRTDNYSKENDEIINEYIESKDIKEKGITKNSEKDNDRGLDYQLGINKYLVDGKVNISIEEFDKLIKDAYTNLLALKKIGYTDEGIRSILVNGVSGFKYNIKYNDDKSLELADKLKDVVNIEQIKIDLERFSKINNNLLTRSLLKFPFDSEYIANVFFNIYIPVNDYKRLKEKISVIESKLENVNTDNFNNIVEFVDSVRDEIRKLWEKVSLIETLINENNQNKDYQQIADTLSLKVQDLSSSLVDKINEINERLNNLENTFNNTDNNNPELNDILLNISDKLNVIESKVSLLDKDKLDINEFIALKSELNDYIEEINEIKNSLQLVETYIYSQENNGIEQKISDALNKMDVKLGNIKREIKEELFSYVNTLVEQKVSEILLKVEEIVSSQEHKDKKKVIKEVSDSNDEEEKNVLKQMTNTDNTVDNKIEEDVSKSKKGILEMLKENPKVALVILGLLFILGLFIRKWFL